MKENIITIIVSVTNNKIFKDCLESSLKKQSIDFKLIKSNSNLPCSTSYNRIPKIRTKYLCFMHQDLKLLENGKFFEKAIDYAKTLEDLGVAGVAGWTEDGKFFGDHVTLTSRTRGEKIHNYYGHQVKGTRYGGPRAFKIKEVQIVDDLFMLISKDTWNKVKFDEENFSFHGLGWDYCLEVKYNLGLKNYVLPLKLYNYSINSYTSEYLKKHGSHIKIYKEILFPKWKDKVKRIRGFKTRRKGKT